MQDTMQDMNLKNYMEDIVINTIDSVLRQTGCCTCDVCRMDIIAIALNNLTPHYVVTQKGEIYARAGELALQFKADVFAAIAKGVQIVQSRPRHG